MKDQSAGLNESSDVSHYLEIMEANIDILIEAKKLGPLTKDTYVNAYDFLKLKLIQVKTCPADFGVNTTVPSNDRLHDVGILRPGLLPGIAEAFTYRRNVCCPRHSAGLDDIYYDHLIVADDDKVPSSVRDVLDHRVNRSLTFGQMKKAIRMIVMSRDLDGCLSLSILKNKMTTKRTPVVFKILATRLIVRAATADNIVDGLELALSAYMDDIDMRRLVNTEDIAMGLEEAMTNDASSPMHPKTHDCTPPSLYEILGLKRHDEKLKEESSRMAANMTEMRQDARHSHEYEEAIRILQDRPWLEPLAHIFIWSEVNRMTKHVRGSSGEDVHDYSGNLIKEIGQGDEGSVWAHYVLDHTHPMGYSDRVQSIAYRRWKENQDRLNLTYKEITRLIWVAPDTGDYHGDYSGWAFNRVMHYYISHPDGVGDIYWALVMLYMELESTLTHRSDDVAVKCVASFHDMVRTAVEQDLAPNDVAGLAYVL